MAELKALVPGANGQPPTLEDVFMALTGKAAKPRTSLYNADEEEREAV